MTRSGTRASERDEEEDEEEGERVRGGGSAAVLRASESREVHAYHKNVTSVGHLTAVFKEREQVAELTVNVSAHCTTRGAQE